METFDLIMRLTRPDCSDRARMRENKEFLLRSRLSEYVRAVNKTKHWISDVLKLQAEERTDFFCEIGMVKVGHIAKFNYYLEKHGIGKSYVPSYYEFKYD